MAQSKGIQLTAQQSRTEVSAAALLLDHHADDPSAKAVYKIGELTREFGVTLRTLRWYGDQGLLKPKRRGTTRLYSPRDRRRIRLILSLQAVGFTLAEIKQMIGDDVSPAEGSRRPKALLRRFQERRFTLTKEYDEALRSLEALDVATNVLKHALKAL